MISKMFPRKMAVSLYEGKNKHTFKKRIDLDYKQGSKGLFKGSPFDSSAQT